LVFIPGCRCETDNLYKAYKNETRRYEELIRKNPKDVKLRLKLAQIYYDFNDFEKVTVLLKDEDAIDAKVMLAKAYANLKEYSKALDVFEQVGEREDDEYMYLYATTLESKNLYPKAVAIYKNVKGKFLQPAQARISKIGIKVEEGLPESLGAILNEEKKFLSSIEKEEAVILLVDENHEIKEDNTSVATVHVIEKVLKEKGKDLAEVEIGYDSTYERVELEYARTITPSGKIIYAGAENTRDVTKYLNFPLYSNARALIVSMPSVDVGSIIEYKLKIYSSKLITDGKFSFIYRLREAFPLAKANFTLTVPKKDKVSLKYFNEEYAKGVNLVPEKKETEKTVSYIWKFKEVGPIIPEEPMPSISIINPAIGISNFSSWEEIYKWWEGLYKEKIALNKEVKEFTANLVKGAKDDFEKARRIYDFCSRNVRYVAVEYGESGYEPHYANDIFMNRYGDCKDKAILLVAMMREAGLPAYPVLIPTREIYQTQKDFPCVNFNHAIAAFLYEGKLIFMDATASTVSFTDIPLSDQERNVVVFLDDKYEIVTTPVPEANSVVYEIHIDIDKNEDAVINRKVTASGFFAAFQRYYLKYTHPDIIKADVQKRMVQISPFSKLIEYSAANVDDFDKNSVLQYSFSAKKVLNPADSLRILPFFDDIDLDPSYAGKDERNFPIEFEGMYSKISKIKINLPENLQVKFLPVSKEVDTPWFKFKSICSQDKNSIEIYREFKIIKRFIQPREYKEFKKNMEEVFYLLKEEAILQKL
jgi:tetratricopeptide (TPR) repeat protein